MSTSSEAEDAEPDDDDDDDDENEDEPDADIVDENDEDNDDNEHNDELSLLSSLSPAAADERLRFMLVDLGSSMGVVESNLALLVVVVAVETLALGNLLSFFFFSLSKIFLNFCFLSSTSLIDKLFFRRFNFFKLNFFTFFLSFFMSTMLSSCVRRFTFFGLS